MTELPKSNGLPAEIRMETLLIQQGEMEQHLFEEKGKVLYMNDSYYIRYEEHTEGTTIPVTVKVGADGVVSVIRRGEITTRLRFDIDQWTQSNYPLPTGTIPIRIKTTDLKISYYDRPLAGRVAVDYSLYVGEEKLGDYQLRLRYTT